MVLQPMGSDKSRFGLCFSNRSWTTPCLKQPGTQPDGKEQFGGTAEESVESKSLTNQIVGKISAELIEGFIWVSISETTSPETNSKLWDVWHHN